MKLLPLSVASACALLTACSFSVSTGSKPSGQPEGTEGSGDGAGDAKNKASSYTVSPESKAWFEECSRHYDAFMSTWKPIEDEAQAVITEVKDASFHVAAPKLAGQIVKTCVTGKKGAWGTQGYADRRGTGMALRIALAKVQLRTKKGAVPLFHDAEYDMVRNLPTTGDDFLDRNAFCLMVQNNNMKLPEGSPKPYFMALGGQPANSVHWLTDAERERFNEKYKAITDDTAKTLEELGKQYVHTGGETGKVKGVKKETDGSITVTAKRVEAPYDCQHTGVYHWDGVAYNDCSYVDRAPVEIYGFTAHFADVPPSDIKVGDFVNFSGTVNGKAPSNVEMANAKWEVLGIASIFRSKKAVYDLPRITKCL